MAGTSDGFEGVRVRAEQLGLFETVVLHGQLTESAAMVAALDATIRQRMASHPGIERSNVGGWHSATDMLDWGGPAAAKLADMVTRVAKRMSHFDGIDPITVEWQVRMWANVSPPGALNMSHAHPGMLWAGVFYVAVPGEGGELYLEDPRFPLPQMTMPGFRVLGVDGQPQPVEHRIAPKAGDLVVFPGWIRHGVRPHQGESDRISIAMNLSARRRDGAGVR